MTIFHVDRTGKPWAFELDCTPIQGRMFQRLLGFVRSIGGKESLTVSFLSDVKGNTAFRDGMEHAVLSALRTWAAEPTHGVPPDEPDGEDFLNIPVRVNEPVGVNPSTVNEKANTNDEPEEREPYYWENF